MTPVTVRRPNRLLLTLRALSRRPPMAASALFLFIVAGAALLAPLLGLPDPNDQQLADRLLPPLSTGRITAELHLFGTDQLGRDMFSRVLAGGRSSASVAVPAVLIATLCGAGFGIAAAYRGGSVDALVQRIADVGLAFPFLLLALLMVAVIGRGIPTLVVAFAFSEWALFARTSRSEALLVSSLPYVESARSVGCSSARILLRHVIPNASTSTIVLATLGVAKVMVAEASLSFLGLGVPPELPSWGSIISDGRGFLSTAWWISAAPGLVLLSVVLSVNRIGDDLREMVDPLIRTVRR